MVFSGEEGGGRYLDLHAHFHRFVNAKFGHQLDYTAFVAALPCTEGVPRQQRLGQPYRCAWGHLWMGGRSSTHYPATKSSASRVRVMFTEGRQHRPCGSGFGA